MKQLFALGTILLGLVSITGCQTPNSEAIVASMLPQNLNIAHRSDKPVKLVLSGPTAVTSVTGYRKAGFFRPAGVERREPNPLEQAFAMAWSEKADAEILIRQAIEQASLFSRVDDAVTNGFILEVSGVSFDPPGTGFSLSSTLATRWKLTRLPDNVVVADELVKATHNRHLGDGSDFRDRFPLAVRGVIRDNIAKGIERLSQTDF